MVATGGSFTADRLVAKLGLIPHPEGGYFLETWRSGSVPMSSRGQTDFGALATKTGEVNADLVVAAGREPRRPDGDARRNALTSIFWMPTKSSPTLRLAVNLSDHVHYYQGGLPFRYHLLSFSTDD